MRLICPNCSAQYEIDGALLPKEGRDVECSKCGQIWFQAPESSDGSTEFDPAARPVLNRQLHDSVLSVLREEAARELRAREQEEARAAAEKARFLAESFAPTPRPAPASPAKPAPTQPPEKVAPAALAGDASAGSASTGQGAVILPEYPLFPAKQATVPDKSAAKPAPAAKSSQTGSPSHTSDAARSGESTSRNVPSAAAKPPATAPVAARLPDMPIGDWPATTITEETEEPLPPATGTAAADRQTASAPLVQPRPRHRGKTPDSDDSLSVPGDLPADAATATPAEPKPISEAEFAWAFEAVYAATRTPELPETDDPSAPSATIHSEELTEIPPQHPQGDASDQSKLPATVAAQKAPGATPAKRGYARGFGLSMGVAVVLAGLYLAAPRLDGTGAVGAFANEFRAMADRGRLWIQNLGQ